MKRLLLTLILLTSLISAKAQSTTDNVQQAFNAGSAKELVKYFSKSTEVKIDDAGKNYTVNQAESILRAFFNQNPPKQFEYIHKGQSPNGLKYNIGQYSTSNSNYRVVMLLKQASDNYLVDTINITKE